MSLKLSAGDFAIAKMDAEDGKGRPYLFRADSISGSDIHGTLVKDMHLSSKRTQIELKTRDLITVLGNDPFPGKSFGCDTSMIFRGRRTHDIWGPIFWFYKPEKEVGQGLMKAFDKAARTINKVGLDFAIDPLTCVWEIVVFNGEKYAGMYKRSSKPDKSPHRFHIRPESMPASEWPYVIFHEFGHHLHMEYATGKKLNAAWVRLYNKTIKVTSIRKDKSEELLEALLANAENRPSDFKSNLSEDDEVAYKLILRQINRDYSLSPKELDLLFEAEYHDDIRAVWPTKGVSKKDLAPLVTEYATKHVKELIAESIAYRLSGKKLPKEVEALVDKTFSYAKSNHEKR
jgi:hypothetical protein